MVHSLVSLRLNLRSEPDAILAKIMSGIRPDETAIILSNIADRFNNEAEMLRSQFHRSKFQQYPHPTDFEMMNKNLRA